MKILSTSALFALFTLTTHASANPLMNYGEVSLSYAHNTDTHIMSHNGPLISPINNEPHYNGEWTAKFKTTYDRLGLKASVDFGGNFFGGVIVSEGRYELKISQGNNTATTKARSTNDSLFIGGAYHIDSNTHVYGTATHYNFINSDPSSMTYRLGVKKAWGNFVGSAEYTLDAGDAHPLSLNGKYYFSPNIFAGAGVTFADGDSKTGVNFGYTF